MLSFARSEFESPAIARVIVNSNKEYPRRTSAVERPLPKVQGRIEIGREFLLRAVTADGGMVRPTFEDGNAGRCCGGGVRRAHAGERAPKR